ncbi:DEAD/DEAH box helicase family protein [Mesorhizobium sp. LNHC252B00]|uniref:DEAD/DEAH box helicase family protein n=1 Tax=Mesorhizobium sp. LNHC252B00 TaxID=1287252 RepID=UPI0003FC1589|nr:DEAD/DEAH box helicase family protein [Mesorhizobium sp. LNHC252B00]
MRSPFENHGRREVPDWAGLRLEQALSRRPEYQDFADDVEEALRKRFGEFGHAPSPEHWEGLRAIIQTIEAMALGVARQKYLLSSLPTGMGKTSTLVEATRELVRLGERTGEPVGIIILTNTLDQIPILIREMKLEDHQYAVRVGKNNAELNAMGVGENVGRHQDAQVLFTTQQKLMALTSKGLNLRTMKGLTFRNKPRPVRIWDEAIMPADAIVLSADDIDRLKSPLAKAGYKAQRDAIEEFVAKMKVRQADTQITVPDLHLPDPEENSALYDDKDEGIAISLMRMAEARAHIRHDRSVGAVALHYVEILPRDFPPLLILDASGSLRLSYSMWREGRGNLERLPSPSKTYKNLTIRHWDHAAGKTANVRNRVRAELADGVAEAVAEADPNQPILIIVRKPSKPYQNMENEIRSAVAQRFVGEKRAPPELHFLTWGRHVATNAYANVRHVIVVGLFQYPTSVAAAMARGSAGLGPGEYLSEIAIDDFHKSEIAHHVFQAVGRGAVRKAIGGDVPEGCRLDVVFSTRGNGASVPIGRDILRKAFPKAQILDWHPLPIVLSSNELALVKELRKIAASPLGGKAPYKELARAVGIAAVNIWKTLERPHVRLELAKAGIAISQRQGRPMWVSRIAQPHARPKARRSSPSGEGKVKLPNGLRCARVRKSGTPKR